MALIQMQHCDFVFPDAANAKGTKRPYSTRSPSASCMGSETIKKAFVDDDEKVLYLWYIRWMYSQIVNKVQTPDAN